MPDYLIFYNDVLIPQVIDYQQGFIDIIRDMNAEIDVVDQREFSKMPYHLRTEWDKNANRVSISKDVKGNC